tara:strand:- start:20 stop:757 length:738 start_codon:yes stop_codon:yes gene_type:complete
MKLIQGDCLEEMKNIPDGSIDMILTDPPYGTTACKWDSIIDLPLMWEQLKRVIKPNGAIVLFGTEPFSSALRMSNTKQYKYDWIWVKNQVAGFVQAKNKPMSKHENIHVFSSGVTYHASRTKNRMPYNPIGLIEVNKTVNTKITDRPSALALSKASKSEYVQTHTGYPDTVLNFNCERGIHPTQKPVALMEYLIKTYTNEGETVLDFAMGSGTTGVACKNLGREFIGIELDENYFNIAKQRIISA